MNIGKTEILVLCALWSCDWCTGKELQKQVNKLQNKFVYPPGYTSAARKSAARLVQRGFAEARVAHGSVYCYEYRITYAGVDVALELFPQEEK